MLLDFAQKLFVERSRDENLVYGPTPRLRSGYNKPHWGGIIVTVPPLGSARGAHFGSARGAHFGFARGIQLGFARGIQLGFARITKWKKCFSAELENQAEGGSSRLLSSEEIRTKGLHVTMNCHHSLTASHFPEFQNA
jgi:hypothetical protein